MELGKILVMTELSKMENQRSLSPSYPDEKNCALMLPTIHKRACRQEACKIEIGKIRRYGYGTGYSSRDTNVTLRKRHESLTQ